MNSFHFYGVFFITFFISVYANEIEQLGCLEKEKSLTLLETAENLLTKAIDVFPTFEDDANSTDQSECGRKKSLLYIELAKKLISAAIQNYSVTPDKPCSNVIAPYDKPRDCFEVLTSGYKENGVYTIWPRKPYTIGKPLKVYCDMKTNGGGWTLIQRRGKFLSQLDFYRNWESYKNGFGNVSEEFWLGNENIRTLCLNKCEIRFDLQDEKRAKGFALYENFYLSDGNYRLSISDYTGNVGDNMRVHNNIDFSTRDKGYTQQSRSHKGGWWYGEGGYYSNLNGVYQTGKANDETVHWYTWRQSVNLFSVEMKVRSK